MSGLRLCGFRFRATWCNTSDFAAAIAGALALLAALLAPAMAIAQPQVLFNNIATPCGPYGPPYCGYYPSFGPTGDFADPITLLTAAQFTPATSGSASDVRVVVVGKEPVGAAALSSGLFNVAIYSDAGGQPGTLIGQSGPNIAWAPYCCTAGIATASFSEPVSLQAGTPYWVVMTPSASNTYVAWGVGGISPVPVAQNYSSFQTCNSWCANSPSAVQFAVDSGMPSVPLLKINTKTIPKAIDDSGYMEKLAAAGGTRIGYTWYFYSGNLPRGFTVSSAGILSSTGSVSATPGTYRFMVQVTDSNNDTAIQALDLVVKDALPTPVNFQETSAIAENGVLVLHYTWESSTGNLDDLKACSVGERVTYPGYPGDGGTYIWPYPWYAESPDPTVLSKTGTQGWLDDTLHFEPVQKPYKQSLFDGTQEFWYSCRKEPAVDFPGWSGVTIERSIEDTTGKGCWTYTVTKDDLFEGVLGTASKILQGVRASAACQ